jgi:D-alanyl-D-alanine carboxypeptidase
MNDKARLMGMTNSHFVNPHGLDAPEHYSTARDLAILAAYAMKNPIFAQTVATKTVTMGSRSLRNHNKLLWQVEGADGVKTGYTKAAGRLLVSSAQRHGRRLVAVTIDDGNDWADHAKLLNDGFDHYQLCQIINKGQCLGSVEIFSGTEERVNVLVARDFSYALAENEKPYVILQPPGFVYAPVQKGENAGFAYICIGDATIGKVPVVYEKTVDQQRPPEKPFWKKWIERILS